MKKTIIGLVEKIIIYNNGREKTILAKIDTGADRSSIDTALARKLKIGPIIGKRHYRSANGISERSLILVRFKIKNRKFKAKFNKRNRSRLKYKVLIGKNILKKGFLINPTK